MIPAPIWRLAVVAALLPLAVAGCGKRGRPLPPEPNAPLAPSDVRLRQVGDLLLVSCTVPRVRGAKPSQALTRIELVRVEFPPGVEAGAEAAVFRRRGRIVSTMGGDPVEPGSRVALVDRVQREEGASLIDWTVRYAVRVRDRRGRASPLVASETIVPLDVPDRPRGLVGDAVADGIELRWEGCGEDGGMFHVYRGDGDGPLAEVPVDATPIETCTFVDGSVKVGALYRYVVHRLSTAETPYRESAPSNEIEVLAADRFAPATPTNLVAVQEGAAVRLFWDPGAERDLRGYRVERAVGEGAWERITPLPVADPLFLDPRVEVGQRIRYRVLAEDGASPPNESAPSDEVVLVVAADPAMGADR